jgi:hypothetical protein
MDKILKFSTLKELFLEMNQRIKGRRESEGERIQSD